MHSDRFVSQCSSRSLFKAVGADSDWSSGDRWE